MEGRTDFKRFLSGCKQLKNAVCHTQGPAHRREGFKFIYDLTSLDMHLTVPDIRMVPFIFNELQAYVLIFFKRTGGTTRMVVADQEGLVVVGAGPTIVTLDLGSNWDNLYFDYAQSGDQLYCAQSTRSPAYIERLAADSWQLVSPTFTSPPGTWGAGDYPEHVTFHQQRLIYGGSANYRQTVWMSKAGSFLDFGVSAPIVDSDAVTFTLDSGTQNKITWLVSAKTLNIGTIGNEWTVSGSTTSALTPTNIFAQRQTNNGSELATPLQVGITTLFLERHGRSINEFVYDYTYDNYKTTDLSVLSDHLTELYSIVDWAYQQTPDSVIWCVREDGDLLGITYQREHEVIGWHTHDTVGEFKAVASVPGNDREDEVWVTVKRVVEGVDKYYLEKKNTQFVAESTLDCRYLDSYIERDTAPSNTFTGLSHLEGHEVAVLVDGAAHPPQTVVSGSIDLDNEYSNVKVGLPFETVIWPNLSEVSLRDGSSEGRSQSIINVDIAFYKTVGAIIGRYDSEDGSVEEEIAFRSPYDLVGQAVPLFTGTKHYNLRLGFDRNASYFIKQTQPLPLTVISVVDTIEIND